jgi:hypothetical protein
MANRTLELVPNKYRRLSKLRLGTAQREVKLQLGMSNSELRARGGSHPGHQSG